MPVTSPLKLRHMVTSPHFEKVRGDVGIVEKCVGMWGRCRKRYERRCRKVWWDVGEVRGDEGKSGESQVREEMLGRSVLGPHFPTPLPLLSPHPFPSHQHTSPLTPCTLPHIFPYPPYTPTHFPTHPMHSPTPLLVVLIMWQCYLNNFNWKNSLKFFTTTVKKYEVSISPKIPVTEVWKIKVA